ncbi:MAG TPA: 3-deoxy-manno-octulosonate cytidylyltransferase [Caulobacteraceae bacterium]|nr:3-deoxy-manno-octulosonate cytidylyltransferase [Caulobacteraceae bacterium]
MNPIVLIPARMAATRLPDKPLADIGGEPLIVRVLRQAEAAGIGPAAVAAGDQVIVDAVEKAGGRAILTDPALPSGSDRILAALNALDPDRRHDAVINLQGDIPFAEPSLVRLCAGLLENQPACDISTIVVETSDPDETRNPDVVKAILSFGDDPAAGRALYFTRSTLHGDGPVWHHLGIYGYRRAALERFTAAQPSPLERREKLEQLRALELGLSIWAAVADSAPIEVNSPEDLALARAHAEAL